MNKQYNLAVDFGNTLVKAGVFESEKIIRLFSSPQLTERKILEIGKKYAIKSCIISSVTNKSRLTEKNLSEYFQTIKLNEKTRLPLKNLYSTQSTLGKDRLASSVAAAAMFNNQNVLVINCGTCITYDLVNNKKQYLGGAISPGLEMRLKALHHYTSNLPLINKKRINSFTGNSTTSSILNGVINGATLEMDGFINTYKKKFSNLKVVLSGGDADYFGSQLKNKIFAVPNMVLLGLNQILLFNDTEKI